MSTILQQNLAKEIVNNVKRKKPKNKGELVELGGYSKTVAEAKPQAIIDQKGVQKELKNLGFSVEGAKKVVQEIMYDKRVKADARLKATDQIFKVHGSYEDTKNGANKTIVINIPKGVAESYGIDQTTSNSNPEQEQIQST